MKLAGENLKGHHNRDGSITFKCDDCKAEHTIRTFPNKYELQVVSPGGLRPWSITQRKQRCPDCTVIAREKGWVK